MKHILLIGFMGCGKTYVGTALAEELGLPFIDIDEQIVQKTGMPISDIFAKHGEQYFRELETEVLKEVLTRKEQTVISTGGGIPMQEANLPLLKTGTVIYIRASIEILEERLFSDESRPVIQDGDLHERIMTLMAVRGPVYEKISDIKVVTSNAPATSVIRQIVEKLVEKNA